MNPTPLSRIAYRPVAWLWTGRIAFGALTLLAGRTGDGKSSLLSDVAARLSRGRPFPDEEVATREPGRIVIFAAEEDPAAALVARACEQEADRSRIAVDDTAFLLDERYETLARMFHHHRAESAPTLLIF